MHVMAQQQMPAQTLNMMAQQMPQMLNMMAQQMPGGAPIGMMEHAGLPRSNNQRNKQPHPNYPKDPMERAEFPECSRGVFSDGRHMKCHYRYLHPQATVLFMNPEQMGAGGSGYDPGAATQANNPNNGGNGQQQQQRSACVVAGASKRKRASSISGGPKNAFPGNEMYASVYDRHPDTAGPLVHSGMGMGGHEDHHHHEQQQHKEVEQQTDEQPLEEQQQQEEEQQPQQQEEEPKKEEEDTRDKIFMCNLCKELYVEMKELMSHSIKCDREWTQREDAAQRAAEAAGSDKPVRKKRKPPAFRCAKCKRQFAKVRAMKMHAFTHKNHFECDRCNKIYLYESAFKRHVCGYPPEPPTAVKEALLAAAAAATAAENPAE